MTEYSGKRILSTAPITPESIQILEQVAPVETAPSPDEETLMGHLENTVGIVCRGEGVITARMVEAAPDLRVVGRPGAGYDSVDLEAIGARKIPLVYAPIGGFAVAEGTVGLLLSLVKRLSITDRALRGGDWSVRYAVPTGDLVTRTLGIVGLGRIGSQVARLIKPFDMRVLGCDPFVDADSGDNLGVELVDFDTLLAESDYVTLHVPLEDGTRGLIDRAATARMKEGAFLLNLARGGVVESLDVLSEALESGQLGGVALDVFPTEPPDFTHRIFQDERCIFTAHNVGTSKVALERILESMSNSMVNVLNGKPPEYCVNPEVFD